MEHITSSTVDRPEEAVIFFNFRDLSRAAFCQVSNNEIQSYTSLSQRLSLLGLYDLINAYEKLF